MKTDSQTKHEEREHFMKCPACNQWFDMRDLAMVFEHEHWLKEKLPVSYSHVKRLDRQDEVYIKVGQKIITMKRAK